MTTWIVSSAWKQFWTPSEANLAINMGLMEVFDCENSKFMPFSDGGDGWLECVAFCYNQGLVQGRLDVMGPLPQQRVEATYYWHAPSRQLFLEAADIHGMRRLPNGQNAVDKATSYGVGQALSTLGKQYPHAQVCHLSVGGSASVEGGLGCLQALGWQFGDASGTLITHPLGAVNMQQVVSVQPVPNTLPFALNVVLDVTTPYVEAPKVFGPQKGASPQQVQEYTQQFHRLANLLDPVQRVTSLNGSGAAGGLVLALKLLASNTQMILGTVWLQQHGQWQQRLQQATCIITGEGCLDDTSLMGKGTGALVQFTQENRIPLMIICGQNGCTQALPAHVHVFPLFENYEGPLPSVAETQRRLKQCLMEKKATIAPMLAGLQGGN